MIPVDGTDWLNFSAKRTGLSISRPSPPRYRHLAGRAPAHHVGADCLHSTPCVQEGTRDARVSEKCRGRGCRLAPLELRCDPQPLAIWRYDIVTWSRSEAGVEPIVQGESITPSWPVSAGACAVWVKTEGPWRETS